MLVPGKKGQQQASSCCWEWPLIARGPLGSRLMELCGLLWVPGPPGHSPGGNR